MQKQKAVYASFAEREKKLEPWEAVIADKFFVYSRQDKRRLVVEALQKPVDVGEEGTDMVKAAVSAKTDMDEMCAKIEELRDTARRMVELHYTLMAEFFANVSGRSHLKDVFPKLFIPYQSAITSCTRQISHMNDYVEKLRRLVDGITRYLQADRVFCNKRNILQLLSKNTKAYNEVSKCYTEYAAICKKSVSDIATVNGYVHKYSQ